MIFWLAADVEVLSFPNRYSTVVDVALLPTLVSFLNVKGGAVTSIEPPVDWG